MKPSFLLAAVAALSFVAVPALADDPQSYDDPGMHFTAPAGFTRVPVPPGGGGGSSDAAPVAVFVRADRHNPLTLQILTSPYDGTLDQGESEYETAVHSSGNVFIKKWPANLANGMPAYWLKEVFSDDRRVAFTYVIVDTKRRITASVAGPLGVIDEKTARDALASLYVVVYPGKLPE